MEHDVAKQEHDGESGRGAKALLALVIGMGVLIVVGVAVLVGVVVTRIMHKHAAPVVALQSSSSVVVPRQLTIPLHHNEHITQIVPMANGHLAVSLQDDVESRLIVWSPEEQRVVSEVIFKANP